ncbi:MAG TPA: SurA N-terminal domain-containing protein [Burkholderiaceae bacterium]|mgnify:FL=1|nr:SurA N-terminal domain-containing protein [Burkholderiaceae bacterium]
MFDSVRKHQRLMQFLLLVLIFPAFAFFGIQGYEKFFADDDTVASVGSSRISRQEYELAHRRQIEQLRQMLGERFDSSMLDNDAARAQILDGLIAQRVLLAEAIDKRIAVSDEQLRRAIGAIPGLVGSDGKFDIDRYRQLLRSQGKSEQMFESEMRSDLALQALPEAISQTAFVPASLVDRMIALGEQTREVRELLFRTADYAAKVNPGDEQLRAWYERNAQAFEVPENARVEYLVLSGDAVARQIEVPEADARAYYEQNKARYGTPEERRASHILVKVEPGASEEQKNAARTRAEELLAKLKAGADFATLAKAESQDPGSAASGGDLGFFTRDTMVKPFADAAFALKEGETSGVVQSEFGFHIIRLTQVKPAAQRDFESVRASIEGEIRAQKAAARFADAAETFSNLVYEQADSLAPAAQRFGLQVQSADEVTRAGNPKLPREHPLNNPRLLAALFSADSIATRRNTEAVDVGGNTLVSARVVEHRPARREPFETVKAQVRERVVNEEAHKLALQAGEARLKALRAGEAPAGLSASRTVTRAPSETMPAAAIDAVFGAPSEPLPAFVGADLGERGYAIYQLTSVNLPDAAQVAQRRDTYRQQLQQVYAQQALGDYLESVKARSKVVSHPERLARAEGR